MDGFGLLSDRRIGRSKVFGTCIELLTPAIPGRPPGPADDSEKVPAGKYPVSGLRNTNRFKLKLLKPLTFCLPVKRLCSVSTGHHKQV